MMITEHHSETLAVWALRTRVWDYLVKPVDLPHLKSRVATLFNGKAGNGSGADSFVPQASLALKREKSGRCDDKTSIVGKNAGAGFEKQLTPAMTFVEANFAEKITLGAVARQCGLGRFQFSRAFKQTHGTTFREFLIAHRIHKAVQMLRIGGASITDVAFSVGFNDLSHFASMFRRYVGVLPSDYVPRKQPRRTKSADVP